jgi:thiosulfate reductase cytochrome b subunit
VVFAFGEVPLENAMTALTTTETMDARKASMAIHPLWVRVTHWINAVAIVPMMLSGWQIYNASPLFPLTFSRSIATGRFRRKLFPISPRAVFRDAVAALTFELSHEDLTVYNAVQRLLYLGVILAGVIVAMSGLAIWKPVQLQTLTAIFGGYDTARYVHFFAMAAIAGFLVIHVSLALLVPKSLRAMIAGR